MHPRFDRIVEMVAHMSSGFTERVEYSAFVQGHIEHRVTTVRQDAYLDQLEREHSREQTTFNGRGRQPDSRPPGCLDYMDLIDKIAKDVQACHWLITGATRKRRRRVPGIKEELRALVSTAVNAGPDSLDDVQRVLASDVHSARVLLGYEQPYVRLVSVVCHCGGTLVVARDASTDVRCVGTDSQPSCGQRYPRHQWETLLEQEP